MSKLKVAITLIGILAVAGCSSNNESGTVRNGPQLENPYADSPGGKLPATDQSVAVASDAAQVVIIDDVTPQTGSIVQTVFR